MSHLLKTSEAEAELLQALALQDFKKFHLDETFQGRPTIMARDLLKEMEGRDPGPAFAQVTLRHCQSKKDAAEELQQIEGFVQSLREAVSTLAVFKTKSVIK